MDTKKTLRYNWEFGRETDVYKRQVIEPGLCENLVLYGLSEHCIGSVPLPPDSCIIIACIAVCLLYTSDVYKRQVKILQV